MGFWAERCRCEVLRLKGAERDLGSNEGCPRTREPRKGFQKG